MDVYVDACKFLITEQKLFLYKIALKNIRKFSNQMPKCPLMAVCIPKILLFWVTKLFVFLQNFNYLVTDMHYNLDDLPDFTPEIKFRFVMSFFVSGKMVAELIVSGETNKGLKLNTLPRNN